MILRLKSAKGIIIMTKKVLKMPQNCPLLSVTLRDLDLESTLYGAKISITLAYNAKTYERKHERCLRDTTDAHNLPILTEQYVIYGLISQ